MTRDELEALHRKIEREEAKYSREKAEEIYGWFRHVCCEVDGPNAGEGIDLAPFQFEPLAWAYGVRDGGKRVCREVFLTWPKKTAKTTIAAGLALYEISEASGVFGAQAFAAANSRDQASQVFKIASTMIRLRPEVFLEFGLSPSKVVHSTKRIWCESTNGLFRALAAEAGTVQGEKPSLLVVDEIHEMPNRQLLDNLELGMGAWAEPLAIKLTNFGDIDGSPVFWEELEAADKWESEGRRDRSYYGKVYKAPDEKEVPNEELLKEEKYWRQVNPLLEDPERFPSQIEFYRKQCADALIKPSKRRNVLRLFLCRSTQGATAWLNVADWDACQGDFAEEDLIGRRCYLGIDLASVRDFTAAVYVFPQDSGTYLLKPFFWIPEESVEPLEKKTGAPLQKWVEQGWMRTTEGNTADLNAIQDFLLTYSKDFDVQAVAFDPYNAPQMQASFESEGYNVLTVPQSYQGLNAPAKMFEDLVARRKIAHDGSDCMRWQAQVVEIQQSDSDLIKPRKPKRDKLQEKARIDGIAATLDAFAAIIDMEQPVDEGMPAVIL